MNRSSRLAAFGMALTLAIGGGIDGSSAQTPAPAGQALALGPKAQLHVASPWVASDVKYRNATELVVKGQVRLRAGAAAPGEFPLARIMITTETRSSHADALERLADIATSLPDAPRFVTIGGWPAVELEFKEA